jgi:hypothetical protein
MIKSITQTIITGVYRTGSEYITQLINCHPQISATMYQVNVMRFIYKKFDPISDKSKQRDALDALDERIQDRYGLSLCKNEIIEMLSEYEHVDYGIFYDVVMTSLYLTTSCKNWAEKNQLLWREIPDFLEIMPEGKAILIIRDPRSILSSFKRYTYAPSPAYLEAVFNCYDAMVKGKYYEQQYDKKQFLCIRYEDIALEPEKWIKKVWSMLGLENGEWDMDNKGWKDAYDSPWHTNSVFHDNSDSRLFNVHKAINGWQKELSNEEIFLVEGVCGELMKEYGYNLAHPPENWLSSLKLFACDDKIMKHFRNWLINAEGIEAFPTDPLKSANWEKVT